MRKPCFPMLLCLLFYFFFSCEWDGDSNYHSVYKGNLDELGIELAGVNPDDIIEIPNRSHLYYTLTDDAYKVVTQRAYLDGKELTSDGGLNRVYIETPSVEDKIYMLQLVVQVRDSSLAGYVAASQGQGMYEGEFTFRLKIIPDGMSRLNIRQSLSENKYMRLDWDNPKGIDIIAYHVFEGYYSNDTIARIDNLNETFLIDREYAFGYKQYVIEGVTRNPDQPNYYEAFIPSYESLIYDDEDIMISDDNHLVFTWSNPNPYPAKYLFETEDGKKVIVDDHSFQVKLPRPDTNFPVMYNGVKMYIIPEAVDINDYKKYEPYLLNLHDPKLSENDYSIDYAFRAPNMLYSISFSKLNVYNTQNNMELIQSVPTDIGSTGAKVKISANGMVAIDKSSGNLEVYSDASLANRVLQQSGVQDFYFGGDRLLLRYFDKEQSMTVYDIHTMQPIQVDGMEDYLHHMVYMSPDGNYILAKYDELVLLKLEGNSLIKVNMLESYYVDIIFNEADYNEVIFTSNDKFEIRNIHTLDLIKTIDGEFRNIDPTTGNLLYSADYSNPITFFVLNKSYNQVLATIKTANLGNPYGFLFDNTLVYNNYFININKLRNR